MRPLKIPHKFIRPRVPYNVNKGLQCHEELLKHPKLSFDCDLNVAVNRIKRKFTQTCLPKLWGMELYMPQREILEIERQVLQVTRDKKVEAITPVGSSSVPCHTEQLRFRRNGP